MQDSTNEPIYQLLDMETCLWEYTEYTEFGTPLSYHALIEWMVSSIDAVLSTMVE